MPDAETSSLDEMAAAAPDNVSEIVDTLGDSLLVVWGSFVEHLPLLAIGVLIVLLTWGASFLARGISRSLMGKRTRPSLLRLVQRLVAIAIWTLGLLLAAMIVFPGLSPAKALGGLGLLSVAVGFAFKDIFENFFAGMLMLWKYPFESGDFIKSGDIMGRVVDINVRMTTIRKVSGELLVVPNSKLFQNPTEVLTDKPKRRVTVMTGVAYSEDLEKAIQVIQKTVDECETVMNGEPVQIFATGFGSSSMDIEMVWWCDSTPLGVRKSINEVVIAVKASLDSAGIEIPFPYRTLTFNEPLKILQQRSDS